MTATVQYEGRRGLGVPIWIGSIVLTIALAAAVAWSTGTEKRMDKIDAQAAVTVEREKHIEDSLNRIEADLKEIKAKLEVTRGHSAR